MNSQFVLARDAVRRSFDRAAQTYDGAAVLAREIANRMLERLDLIKVIPQRLLDLGSGTGYCAQKLRSRYPRCMVVELDFAPNMLLRSRGQRSWWRRGVAALTGDRVCAVCADMERLPFADRSFDMVWSNLALNWLDTPLHVFAESRRVLRPGGVFMFSTLGPDTLKELRVAAGATRVHEFIDMHDLGDMLIAAGFSAPVMDMEQLGIDYRTGARLLDDLRASGQTNARLDRSRGLVGGQFLRAFRAAPLRSTFEVVYGHGWKRAAVDREVKTVRVFKRIP